MKLKKILAVTLCFFTVFSFTGLGAFASAKNQYPEDHDACHYMAFGDSFSRGMGCSDTWYRETQIEYQYGQNQSRCITGAYPTLVAEALDCELSPNNFLEEKDSTFWPILHNGMTLASVMDLLGINDDFYDDAFYHATWSACYPRYNKFLKYFGCPESFSNDCDEPWGGEGTTYNIRSMVENMDVITLQLGQSDVLNIPLFQALHECIGMDSWHDQNLSSTGGFSFSANCKMKLNI